MEAIFVLIGFALALLYLGMFKKDLGILFFSSVLNIIGGLNIIVYGFGNISSTITNAIGLIFMFIGIYIIYRSVVDLFQRKSRREVK